MIVGRCADYALKDFENHLSVFIHAPMSFKKERINKEHGIPLDKVKDECIKMDKQRAGYYNYYTSRKWGELKNYDLSVNSSVLGIDGSVELIRQAVGIREAGRVSEGRE